MLKMRVRTQLALIVLVGLLLVVLTVLSRYVTGPRVVGRAVTPEGIEMCVVQRLNWGEDPFFSTRFIYRKPGGVWKGFYYHHEDDFWSRSRATLDTNTQTAVFYRNNKPAITFAWRREEYVMHRRKDTNTEPWTMESKWCPR